MEEIRWSVKKWESEIISKITKRAYEIVIGIGGTPIDFTSMQMDLTACHCNGNPLRLQELFNAERFDFCHDVFGITENIDRNTGKLMNFFLPRYSQLCNCFEIAGDNPDCTVHNPKESNDE